MSSSLTVPYKSLSIDESKSYRYRVRSRDKYNGYYSSWTGYDYTNTVTTLTCTPGKPNAPSVARTGTSVVVTWSAPSAGKVENYRLQRRGRLKGESLWSDWETISSGNVLTYTDSESRVLPLVQGHEYQYQIQAENDESIGDQVSGWSNASVAVYVPYAPPAEPNFDDTVGGAAGYNGVYDINWSAAGGMVEGFHFQKIHDSAAPNPVEGNWSALEDIQSNSPQVRSYDQPGNFSGALRYYHYRVKAYNRDAQSDWVTLTVVVNYYPHPGAVDVFEQVGLATAAGNYTVRWEPPAGDEEVTHYKLDRLETPGVEYPSIADEDGQTGYTQSFSGGVSGQTYTHTIEACFQPNEPDAEEACSGSTFTVDVYIPYPVPNTPADLTGPDGSLDGSFEITWSPSTSGTLDHYELEETLNGGSNIINAGTLTAFSRSGANGHYEFRVRACSPEADGPLTPELACSPWSGKITFTVATVPAAPTPVLANPLSFGVNTAAIDQSRTLPGEFNVSPGGQATYEIPIVTAPGTAGLVPNISLHYSSGGGNGLLGMGWSINGLGGIDRCRQTWGQDRNVAPITWSANDRFCLNGERLLVTAGNYGYPGSTYKTEIDNHAKITAIGGSTGHPAYFIVEYKNGLVETYGNTADSIYDLAPGKVLSWALNERRDSLDNTISYHYSNDSDGQRLDRIEYAFGSSSSRGAHIAFGYENRNDPLTGYVAGYATRTGKRLKTIASYNNENEIRRYTLTYNQASASTTNDELSRINKIQECVGALCSQATHFDWSIPASSLPGNGVSLTLTGGIIHTEFGDINGDGLTDVIWQDLNQSLRYALATANSSGHLQFITGTFGSGSTIYPGVSVTGKFKVMDVNADGRSDVLMTDGALLAEPQANGDWRLSGSVAEMPGFVRPTNVRPVPADLNGDGLPDVFYAKGGFSGITNVHFSPTSRVFYMEAGGDVTTSMYYQLGSEHPVTQPVGGFAACELNQICSYAIDEQPIRNIVSADADFNGDGRVDVLARAIREVDCDDADPDGIGVECILRYRINPYLIVSDSTGAVQLQLYGGSNLGNDTLFGADEIGHFLTADLNDDGLSDLVYGREDLWRYRLNTGTGFTPAEEFTLTHQHLGRPSLADVNNDNYPDFVWVDGYYDYPWETNFPPGKLRVKYWNPTTNRFSESSEALRDEMGIYGEYVDHHDDNPYGYTTHTRYPHAHHLMVDFNGDGKVDFVRQPARDSGAVTVVLNTAGTTPTNKITDIRTDLGDSTKIQYEPINQSSHYTRISGFNVSTHTREVCTSNPGGYFCWDVETAAVDAGAFYRSLNDPWHDLEPGEQSLRPSSPILEALGPMYVVTSISQSAPAATGIPGAIDSEAKAHTGYFYEQAKLQAGGRGFLGFKRFTVLNTQTGMRTTTEYRQDWPFTGVARKQQTLSPEGKLLSESQYTWGFVDCYDAGGNADSNCEIEAAITLEQSGSRTLGALQLFQPQSIDKRYALRNNGTSQGEALSEVTTTLVQDDKGNVTLERVVTTGVDGYLWLDKTTTSTYLYEGSTWSMQMGRLSRMDVSSTDGGETLNRSSSFTYYTSGNAVGLLATETIEPDQPNYRVTITHSYDGFGNKIQSSTTADGQTRYRRIAYDARGRYVERTWELFNGGVERLVSEVVARDGYGTPTEVRKYVDTNSTVTIVTGTTEFGTPYFSAESAGTWTYTVMGEGADPQNVCPYGDTITFLRTRSAGGSDVVECRDIRGRTLRKAVRGFDGVGWSAVDTEYDSLNRVIRASEPYYLNQQSAYWTENQNYDLLDRVRRIEHPQPGAATAIVYDGNTVRTTNPNSHTRTEITNPLGQVVETVDPMDGVTRFTYDPRGNLKTMTDPANNTTVIDYDLRDRKVAMSDPDKGNWTYRYNRFNELICQRDAKGQMIRQSYDVRGRLVSRQDYTGGNCDSPGGTPESDITWNYDTAVNGLGQLDTVEDSASGYEKQISYDTLGRVSSTRIAFPGHNGQPGSHYERITYDEYGRVFQMFDAARNNEDDLINGIQHVYQNGYRHRLIHAAYVNGQPLKAYYEVQTMDARGNVTEAWYGNGVMQFADHDPATGRVTDLWASNGGLAPLQDLSLDWDLVGNLESRHETGLGAGSVRRDLFEEFDYDAMNRLTNSTLTGDASATQTVDYNAIGNITFKTGVGTYSYNPSGPGAIRPHAVIETDGISYSYDDNGNQTSGNGRTITYTVSDLPKTISKGGHLTEFWYGPGRARFKRVDTAGGNKVTTLYLGSVEKVYHADGTIQWKRNIGGVALMIQILNSSGGMQSSDTRYLLKDHLGTLSLITDENGDVVEEYYFDAWGKRRHIARPAPIAVNPFGIFNEPTTTRGYTGHEQLDEVGLIHMNGRIYDDTLSRFVQADPIIQDPYKTESLNRYSYVWNNPLNATDPSGFIAGCGGGDAGDDAKCQQEKVAEESHRKEGNKESKRSRQSGLGWKVKDRKAFNEYLKKSGLTEKQFAEKMEKNGISKASIGSRGTTIGGAVMDSKGNVGIIPSSVQAQNPIQGSAAKAALGDASVGNGQELLLSQRKIPQIIKSRGYVFDDPIEAALHGVRAIELQPLVSEREYSLTVEETNPIIDFLLMREGGFVRTKPKLQGESSGLIEISGRTVLTLHSHPGTYPRSNRPSDTDIYTARSTGIPGLIFHVHTRTIHYYDGINESKILIPGSRNLYE